MAVRMLVQTNFRGLRKAGDVVKNLPKEIELRWVDNGIAEVVAEEEAEANYEDMSTKKLYTLCKQREIEVEPKQSAEYYIAKLEEYDAAQ